MAAKLLPDGDDLLPDGTTYRAPAPAQPAERTTDYKDSVPERYNPNPHRQARAPAERIYSRSN